MHKAQKIFLVVTFLWTVSGLALENMRPGMELINVANGVIVNLDFTTVQTSAWTELLSKPESFYQGGYGLTGKPGDPALPTITQLIPVRSVENPQVTLLSTSTKHLPAGYLKLTPPGRQESDPSTIIHNFDWDATHFVEKPMVKLGQLVTMRGQTFLPLTITPVMLDRNNRTTSVAEHLEVQISGITTSNLSTIDEGGNPLSIIDEADIYDQLGHYLIITPPLYEPYLEPLVEWKERKGHPVTVVNTNVSGNSPTTIKSFIQTAYDTWEDPPQYVLLIGDEDRGIGGFYVYNPDNEALVTDHPYVLLDGDDSFPEAWVGRLSVDTIGELITLRNKILKYERDPYLEDPEWFKRGLLVCTVTAAISTQHINNWVGRKLIENGFTQVDTAYYPMQSSLTNISTPITNGVGFVNYRGLGAWDHWIGPYFYNSDINNLHNGFKLPIVTSIVCGGGNFAAPVDPVFGEKWIRAGTSSVPKGAVAFIGPSEVHTHTQFNNVINVGLYSGIFDLGMNELGPALWHGKLNLWRNYYQSEYLPFGQSAEFYHHVYVILGDPGMAIWTDTPQQLTVDHPTLLNRSDDHISLTVQDEMGAGIANAFVYLLNDDNAQGSKTDASGRVTLPIYSGADTTLNLTITGKNLDPYLMSIPITDDVNPLDYSGWGISPSGILEAGGNHGLDLTLNNQGETIESLLLTLSSTSEGCMITDSIYVIENFHSDASMDLEDIFDFDVHANARHGEVIELKIKAEVGIIRYNWERSFPIQAPALQIADIDMVSGALVAGDSIRIRLNVRNKGGLACPETILNPVEHPLISTGGQGITCPAIEVDETVSTQSDVLLVLSDQIFPGEVLDLEFISENGMRFDTLSAELTIEQINRFTPSSPDGYGYRVYDDMDVSYSLAPEYDWLEIDPELGGEGSRLAISDLYEEDDAIVQMDLPFTVTYYGQDYDAMTVCSNGWLALGYTPEVSFYNRVIPAASGPNAMIAPFWDDLLTDPGGVSYKSFDDRFIIEWSRMRNLDVFSTLNFQVIIYNTDSHPTSTGDNMIKMQFKDYYNYDTWTNFSTTGIESPDYRTGLQVGYNNIADRSIGELRSQQALLYTTQRAQRYPASEMGLSQTNINFVLNPWSSTSDSITITNNGGSPLVYSLAPINEPEHLPASNPLADYEFVKGGAEPDGSAYQTQVRDLFDYEWLDQDDVGGPTFAWVDISQPENERPFTGDPDDSSIGPFEIGFEFPFFSEIYTSFFFSSNGTMSFVSDEYPWANLTLPNGAAPAALIAPWWDDLNNNAGLQGVPYFWTNGVDTAVVCWDDFPKFNTNDRHTFEVVLIANGDILFQYLEMAGTRRSSTVGIQNETKTKGLQVYYNTDNDISAGSAILIHRQLSWLKVNAWSGSVEPAESGVFRVDVDTRGFNQGTFSLPLMLSSNSSNIPEIPINVNLEVIHGVPPLGDVTGDYQINILDITLLIEFALFIETPSTIQFESADLLNDEHLDVLDVVQLVELILSE